MSTIRLHENTTSTPEQFIAGLTDFGPGRSKVFTAYLLKWTQELEFAKCVAGHGFCVVDVELRRLWSGADEVG